LLLGIFHLLLFFTRFVKHSLVFNVVIWYTPVFYEVIRHSECCRGSFLLASLGNLTAKLRKRVEV
jgi:hypothetical protein